MKIIYSEETQIFHLEGGRMGLGKIFFPGRQSRGETYQVRLSPRASAMLALGDKLEWWDTDSSCLPAIDCAGTITKLDGRVYHLIGSRDAGIDTGHPPHLGLRMVQEWKVCWEADADGFKHHKVAYSPWGVWYRYDSYRFPPLEGIHSHEQMLMKGAEAFSGDELIYLDNGSRYRLDIKYHGNPSQGWKWQTGWLWKEKKVIKMCDTETPLVS